MCFQKDRTRPCIVSSTAPRLPTLGSGSGAIRALAPSSVTTDCFAADCPPLDVLLRYLTEGECFPVLILGIRAGQTVPGSRPGPAVRRAVQQLAAVLRQSLAG